MARSRYVILEPDKPLSDLHSLSERVMREKLEHIQQNPVKRGVVCLPEHWHHSSTRNYIG